MDLLPAGPAADDLHRFGMLAVGAGAYPAHAGKPGREQCSLPGLQPLVTLDSSL